MQLVNTQKSIAYVHVAHHYFVTKIKENLDKEAWVKLDRLTHLTCY